MTTKQIKKQLKILNCDDIYVGQEMNYSRDKIIPIDVADLAKSISEKGLIQPITVSHLTTELKEAHNLNITIDKKYILRAGFRRYFASHVVLKNTDIECIINDNIHNDLEAVCFNLAENLERRDLNMMEEARALEHLKKRGIGEVTVADMIGKSRGWVQVRYMALDLPEEVQEEAAAGMFTQKNIRELKTIQDTEGKAEVYKAAKVIKESKAKGIKTTVSVNVNKKKKDSKHIRSKSEIHTMQDTILDRLGSNLGTRCLAWAAGEISSQDLYEDCKDIATKTGKFFPIPN